MAVKVNADRSRSWMLTVPADRFSLEDMQRLLGSYTCVFQLERGKEKTEKNPDGYLHWQCYIENETAIRFNTLRRLFSLRDDATGEMKPVGIHIERRRGSRKEAFAYCTKADTRVSETFYTIGEIDTSREDDGSDSSWLELREAVLAGRSVNDLLVEEPKAMIFAKQLREVESANRRAIYGTTVRDVDAHFIWGASGVGKTFGITEHFGWADLYRVTDYKNPWDNYNGESVLLLDEFRGQLDFSFFLTLLEGYPLQLPARYSNRWASWEKVFVVSNRDVDAIYPEIQGFDRDALLRRFRSVQFLGSREDCIDFNPPAPL